MIENPSQKVKEISDQEGIENSTIEENTSETPKEENLTYNAKDIPSADSSSSRRNSDLDTAGFTQEEFASLLGKYDYNFKPGDLVKGTVFALEVISPVSKQRPVLTTVSQATLLSGSSVNKASRIASLI